ncbi:type IV pili methyl-accepting chemotaxis transducer N-terminal domain-containing protein [Roseobacter sinensis]|uniref:Type IV pili methyl-accepting chemotaxis transducer N-terminal domain-containing protein n=1 Tax=Roseobacter sinensis TaxID=2931391 RepID=A0ABT3BC61_9RHOB|nr:type IV pili methyl-accepting chemotaxis transducer N-terminal domain-containing protein [Roseobacter sp. WL0113]MCV3271161.1 type IV pili methyl-accepting chemotaxis transducer N-terminal domain-containing protein [Roseobacter sp. WL0113]
MFRRVTEKCAVILMAVAVATPVYLGQAPAVSAETTAESNAGTRINLAGRQRMLTQQMARNACLVMAGVDPERFVAKTETNVQQFNDVLAALRYGDETLGLLPETNAEVLAALARVEALWATLGPAARQVAAGDFHSVPMAQLINMNMATLAEMHAAVLTIQTAHQTDNIPAGLLKTVQVAGRQRMLTQKISKEVCFAIIGLGDLGSRELVETTMRDFDSAMAKLMGGSEEDGIIAPPSDAVKRQLELTNGTWMEFKALVAAISDDTDVDHATRVQLANISDQVLKEMNQAVGLYVE